MGRPVASGGGALHGNAGSHSVQRRNPGLLERRLFAAGRAGKVALVAGLRKLRIILNSMVKAGRNWDPQTTAP